MSERDENAVTECIRRIKEQPTVEQAISVLRAHANEVRRREREACAILAEATEIVLSDEPLRPRITVMGTQVAAAIRARGEKEQGDNGQR